MECPKCGSNGRLDELFEILKKDNFSSIFNEFEDFEKVTRIKCKQCGHEFVHIDLKSKNIKEKIMNFEKALTLLNKDKKLYRKAWSDKGSFILRIENATFYDNVERVLKTDKSYLQLITSDGKQVPWFASQADIFTEDWEEHKEEN